MIAFLGAQLARLREPLGILVLDDLPGMLSPRGFDRMALPYLQRVFDSFPDLVRIYHNDTPCAHLLPRMGQLHCEMWNFSHEMDIAAVKAAVPRFSLLGNVAPLGTLVRGHAGAGARRGARLRREGRAGRRLRPLGRRRRFARHAGREHRRAGPGRAPAPRLRRYRARSFGGLRRPTDSGTWRNRRVIGRTACLDHWP